MVFSPALILILGGILMLFTTRSWRNVLTVLLPLVTLAQIWSIDSRTLGTMNLMGYELITVFAHDFSHIFATVFAIAALRGGIFPMHARLKNAMVAAFIFSGPPLLLSFAIDLISLFLCWSFIAL